MSEIVDIGTSAILEFQTWTSSSQGQLAITSIELSGTARPSIKTSHLETSTWDSFIPGDLTDPGEISFEGHFDTQDPLTAVPPFATAASAFVLKFPIASGDSTAARVEGSAFLVDFSQSIPLEDVVTCSGTLKLTGSLTYFNAS